MVVSSHSIKIFTIGCYKFHIKQKAVYMSKSDYGASPYLAIFCGDYYIKDIMGSRGKHNFVLAL